MTMRSMLLALAALIWLAPAANAQSATFFAVLNGGNECKSLVGMVCGVGDTDGVGSATVTIISETRLCAGLVVDNIATPTAAHIHLGPSAVNGPVRVTLPAPTSGNPGTSSGCATVDSAIIAAIAASPQNFYINVHTSNYSGGAIRGQLF